VFSRNLYEDVPVNEVERFLWREKHVRGFLTNIQRELIDSALTRDDVEQAKKFLRDWKVLRDDAR
jgi:hypothetical protein